MYMRKGEKGQKREGKGEREKVGEGEKSGKKENTYDEVNVHISGIWVKGLRDYCNVF